MGSRARAAVVAVSGLLERGRGRPGIESVAVSGLLEHGRGRPGIESVAVSGLLEHGRGRPGIESVSPALAGDSSPLSHQGSPVVFFFFKICFIPSLSDLYYSLASADFALFSFSNSFRW